MDNGSVSIYRQSGSEHLKNRFDLWQRSRNLGHFYYGRIAEISTATITRRWARLKREGPILVSICNFSAERFTYRYDRTLSAFTLLRIPLIRNPVTHWFDSTRPSLFIDPENFEHPNPPAERFVGAHPLGKHLYVHDVTTIITHCVLYQKKSAESHERYRYGMKFTVGASVSKETDLQGFRHPLYFTKRRPN